MKHLKLLLSSFVLTFAISSYGADHVYNCETVTSAADKVLCDSKEYSQADILLNKTYKETTKFLKNRYGTDSYKLATLKERQREWISERDRTCTKSSLQGITTDLKCATKKTKERTQELIDLVIKCRADNCSSH